MSLKQKVLISIGSVLVLLLIFVLINILVIKYNGQNVPAPEIPSGPQELGEGQPLTYVVMGDSTAVTQGAEYSAGYALISAQHLAKNHKVTFVNTGVSGARSKDVADKQLPEAVKYKPDVVLIAVGANDANHLTGGKVIEESIQKTIDQLRVANKDVAIVVTGSVALDTVDRYTAPAKWLAYQRVKRVNKVFDALIQKNNLTYAPIADKTRAIFKADPTLFAKDKFHPNARGYAVWVPVINQALDEALSKK